MSCLVCLWDCWIVSLIYLFLKPSFSSFWSSSLNVMLTIIYVSNHDHGSSVLSACSVSFNTADGMAFKQNRKKKNQHIWRKIPAVKQPAHLYNHRHLEPVNIFLHFSRRKANANYWTVISTKCFHSHHKNFSLSPFSPSYVQTHSQEDKVHTLLCSKEN